MRDSSFFTRRRRRRSGGNRVPRLRSYHIDGDLPSTPGSTIEVTLHFSDGSRRWCLIATSEYLVGLKRAYSSRAHGGNHMIVVDHFDHDTIERVLFDLDAQSLLVEQTCPLA